MEKSEYYDEDLYNRDFFSRIDEFNYKLDSLFSGYEASDVLNFLSCYVACGISDTWNPSVVKDKFVELMGIYLTQFVKEGGKSGET